MGDTAAPRTFAPSGASKWLELQVWLPFASVVHVNATGEAFFVLIFIIFILPWACFIVFLEPHGTPRRRGQNRSEDRGGSSLVCRSRLSAPHHVKATGARAITNTSRRKKVRRFWIENKGSFKNSWFFLKNILTPLVVFQRVWSFYYHWQGWAFPTLPFFPCTIFFHNQDPRLRYGSQVPARPCFLRRRGG